MFKKTLLATALTAVAMNAAAVTVVVTTPEVVSIQGAANKTSVTVPSTVLTLGTEYTANDIITLTVTGASFDTTTSVPSIAFLDIADNTVDDVTISSISETTSAITFRVTNVDNADNVTHVGDTVTITGLALTTASVIDGADASTVSLAFSALTSGTNLALDNTGTLSDDALTLQDSFAATVTGLLNAVVDVDNDRQQFTAATGTLQDVLAITPTEDGTITASFDPDYTGAVHTISGDFTFMDTDIDGAVSSAELTAHTGTVQATDAVYVLALNAGMDTLTATVTEADNTPEVHTIQFDTSGVGAGAPIVDAGLFTVGSTVQYLDAGTAPANATTAQAAGTGTLMTAGTAAGEWTLNGSIVTIPYMPFGANTNVILRGTNTSSQSGDMTVRYMLEGVDTTWNTITAAVTTLTPGVTNLTSVVMDAIMADAGATSGKVAIEITTNVPATALTLYAAYKVTTDSDRGFVGTFGHLGTNKN